MARLLGIGEMIHTVSVLAVIVGVLGFVASVCAALFYWFRVLLVRSDAERSLRNYQRAFWAGMFFGCLSFVGGLGANAFGSG